MGARHPEEVLAQLNANKNEFVLAATYLVRMGICKSGPDAIRYMEKNNSNIDDIINEYIEVTRPKPPVKTEE
jgi:hypothetical protein